MKAQAECTQVAGQEDRQVGYPVMSSGLNETIGRACYKSLTAAYTRFVYVRRIAQEKHLVRNRRQPSCCCHMCQHECLSEWQQVVINHHGHSDLLLDITARERKTDHELHVGVCVFVYVHVCVCVCVEVCMFLCVCG